MHFCGPRTFLAALSPSLLGVVLRTDRCVLVFIVATEVPGTGATDSVSSNEELLVGGVTGRFVVDAKSFAMTRLECLLKSA